MAMSISESTLTILDSALLAALNSSVTAFRNPTSFKDCVLEAEQLEDFLTLMMSAESDLLEED